MSAASNAGAALAEAPSFGIGGSTPGENINVSASQLLAAATSSYPNLGERAVPADDDELDFAASTDKIQEMTEQLAEFLVTFSESEQQSILEPFLCCQEFPAEDDTVDPVVSEARRFICNYLTAFSHCERDLILEKWRPAMDTSSLASATESMTPSVTPPGSATPTAVTPREFLSKRRAFTPPHDPDTVVP